MSQAFDCGSDPPLEMNATTCANWILPRAGRIGTMPVVRLKTPLRKVHRRILRIGTFCHSRRRQVPATPPRYARHDNGVFSAKYTDPETGLILYPYRPYLPALGRWLTQDPLGEQGGENLYVFCGNAATYQVDPTGLFWGFLTARVAKKLEDLSNNGENSVLVTVWLSFGSQTWQAATGLDPIYRTKQTMDGGWQYVFAAKDNGVVATAKQLSGDAHQAAAEVVGSQDLLNAVDQLDQYTWWEQGMYGLSAAGKAASLYLIVDFASVQCSSSVKAPAGNRVNNAAQSVEKFIGPDAEARLNTAGDVYIESSDGLRRIQFHIKKTTPHKNPHMHIEVSDLIKNKKVPIYKSGPIYPKDVPHE